MMIKLVLISFYCLFFFLEEGKSAIFITEDDIAYGIGENKYGCLGVGDDRFASEPRKIDALCGQNIIGN